MPYSVGILSPLEGSDMVPYGSPLGGYTSSQIEAIFLVLTSSSRWCFFNFQTIHHVNMF